MISILLVGVGGYGGLIAEEVLNNDENHGCSVVGVVEPYIENSPVRDIIKDKNIFVYDDIKDFYKDKKADIAIISTPIHLHKNQCICAMENGSDVLCEKPIAPTLQDAYAMKECAEKTGKHLHIGFQLSHAPAIINLKKDIMAGVFGELKAAYATVCWPRNGAYFARPWAAKAKVDGNYVLDSIAMNACAHYLHNMFFLSGETLETSSQPESIGASLYRANSIETYDTACIKVTVKGNIPFCFNVSHATEYNINPLNKIIFEKARVYISEEGGDNSVYAVFDDGTKKEYGATFSHRFKKIWYAVDVFNGKKQPICTVDTALPHLKCVNAVSQFFKVNNFADVCEKDGVKYVKNLDRQFTEAFENEVMPEIYQPEYIADIKDYSEFEGLR